MGAAAIPIAIALSAGATAYGIYSGERARAEAGRARRDEIDRASRERNEELARNREQARLADELRVKQETDQRATEERLRQEQATALSKAKAEVPGIQNQLGSDLLAQQQTAYNKLSPQIEARLNALGLLQSGALPEAQAKAQGDLESQRQATLAQFSTNAAQRLSIDQPLANSSSDVSRQYEGMQRNLDLDRQNLSQRFANDSNSYQNQIARNQYLAGLSAAQTSANQSAANAYVNFGGQIGSGLISYYGNQNSGYKPNAQSQGGSGTGFYSPNPRLNALYRSRGTNLDPYSGVYGSYR